MGSQAVCLMPTKCVKCEELFDMSYDYPSFRDEGLGLEKEKVQLVCWDCRLNAIKKKN